MAKMGLEGLELLNTTYPKRRRLGKLQLTQNDVILDSGSSKQRRFEFYLKKKNETTSFSVLQRQNDVVLSMGQP